MLTEVDDEELVVNHDSVKRVLEIGSLDGLKPEILEGLPDEKCIVPSRIPSDPSLPSSDGEYLSSSIFTAPLETFIESIRTESIQKMEEVEEVNHDPAKRVMETESLDWLKPELLEGLPDEKCIVPSPIPGDSPPPSSDGEYLSSSIFTAPLEVFIESITTESIQKLHCSGIANNKISNNNCDFVEDDIPPTLIDDTDDDALRRQLIGRIMPRGDFVSTAAKQVLRLLPA